MKTLLKTKRQPARTRYDRRQSSRTRIHDCSLFFLSKGQRIAIPLINATHSGARVVLPGELSHRTTITLVCKLARLEFLAEYQVVWKQAIAGHKVIAGLHCVFEGKRKAA